MRIINRSFTCSFCGKECLIGGVWITENDNNTKFHCCHDCAIEVLPRLMADAVHTGENPYDESLRCLEKASGNFWTAMTARLCRRGYYAE